MDAAFIGAGISGLTSAKNLTDAGVEIDCFESSDRIDGNWAFRNPNGHSSAYRSLHIDTSRDCLSLKDFPMSDVRREHVRHPRINKNRGNGVGAVQDPPPPPI